MTQYIVFGWDCRVAEILNRGGLREFSLPFDFMFAFPCHIKDSLDKDFSDWLDPEHLTVLDHHEGHKSTKHSLYDSHTEIFNRNTNYSAVHAFFNHHDLSDPKDIEIFKRRISRYRKIMASDENVVFVTNSSIESFREVGLNNYYQNRSGKTEIVYLKRVHADGDTAMLTKIGDDYVLEFNSLDEHNDKASMAICNVLRENFG